MNIGKTIKNLRRERDMTQEQLAEYLNISSQAVSRWETDLALPDITLLPTLANLLGVSIDELLGMNESRDINIRVHERRNAGDFDGAVTLLRDEIKLFPHDWGLLSELAVSLSFGDQANIQEAITLCEKALAGSPSEKCRSTTRALLCLLYMETAEQQKAAALVGKIPHLWESREMLKPEVQTGEEKRTAIKDCVNLCLSVLCQKIQSVFEPEDAGKRAKKLIAEAVCEHKFSESGDFTKMLDYIAEFMS